LTHSVLPSLYQSRELLRPSLQQPVKHGRESHIHFKLPGCVKEQDRRSQHYALSAGTPPGWSVVFRANYKQATSVDVLPNAQADIAIDIDPADRAEAGTYKIPVVASSNATSEKLELEAVITGTYGMVLTTSDRPS